MSLSRMMLLLAGITLLLLAGCRKAVFFSTETPSTAPATTPVLPVAGHAPRVTVSPEQLVVQTVTAYLTALQQRNYRAAYDMLSRDSQIQHSPADFERRAKEGVPQFELPPDGVSITGNRAGVVLWSNREADRTTHDYPLIREGGKWKVVYRGGIPIQPYDKE